MFNISVERKINKPIKDVFEILADHANYKKFKGVDESSLITTGITYPNGVGAIREIVANGATLHEEIVKYEPPEMSASNTKRKAVIGYKIVYSKPLPYKHELGEVHLSEIGTNTTYVKWISNGTITTPILGKWFFDKQIQKNGSRAFGSILKYIDTH
jgi:hypothetical protein